MISKVLIATALFFGLQAGAESLAADGDTRVAATNATGDSENIQIDQSRILAHKASDMAMMRSGNLNFGSHYDWGRAQNGYGYCYEWTSQGYVLNGGQPIANFYCEQTRPSLYNWGRANNGYTYCYQWTPDGYAMNGGQPVANFYCR